MPSVGLHFGLLVFDCKQDFSIAALLSQFCHISRFTSQMLQETTVPFDCEAGLPRWETQLGQAVFNVT